MEVAKHLQRTQDRKFVIFLQYLKKNIDDVHFLHANVLGVFDQTQSKFP